MRGQLEAHAEVHSSGSLVFNLNGDLFGSVAGYAFQEDVRKKIADGVKRIVVDASDVYRIDSSGVGILVAIMWSASNAGTRLVFAGLPSRIQKVLSLAMLLDHIDHTPTLEEALSRVSGDGAG